MVLSPLLRLPPDRSRGVVHDHRFGSVHRGVLLRVRVGVVPVQVVPVRVLPEVTRRHSVGVHERNQLHGVHANTGTHARATKKNGREKGASVLFFIFDPLADWSKPEPSSITAKTYP